MSEFTWPIVVLAAIVLVIAFVVRPIAGGRTRPNFSTRSLPAGYFDAYQTRMVELQSMFVERPRESVSGAKHMCEDLMLRLGYPTRLTEEERRADLASLDRRHGELYKKGVAIRPESTTEELRRSLQAYLHLSRALIQRAKPDYVRERGTTREIAG